MTVVRIHGAELFVQDSGGGGRPVVFLHGWLADGRMFEPQVQVLRDRFRCITVDFRGAGRSSRPTSGYQVEQHAADVRATLRHLGLARVHLVGFSLGGMVAMRLAARDPDLVASVTLGNTTARANPGTKVAPYLSVALLIRTVGPALPGDLDQGLFGTAFRNDPANRQVRRTWQQRRAQLDNGCAVRTLAGMMIRPDVRAELPDISCPTLVITGSADAQTPAAHGQEIHDAIPGSRYLELPGVGHCAPIEAPTQVAEALAHFLTDVPPLTA
jgi:pimeloyl-ACP methyl ester carboxylesterase